VDQYTRDEAGGSVSKYRGHDIYAKGTPGVLLTLQRICPEAETALDAEEYEERIARYSRLIKAGLPTPLFSVEQPPVRVCEAKRTSEMTCWACGAIAPRAGSQKRTARASETLFAVRPAFQPKAAGKLKRKRSRRERERMARGQEIRAAAERERARRAAEALRARHSRWVSRMLNAHTTETYCRDCFDLWGWPDGFDAAEALADAVVAALVERGARH
jgi:hypothetical protein